MPNSLESQKSSNIARRCAGTAPSCHPRNIISSRRVRLAYLAGTGRPSPSDTGSLFAQLFVNAMTRHLPAAGCDGALVSRREGRNLDDCCTSDTPYRLYDPVVEDTCLLHHPPEQLTATAISRCAGRKQRETCSYLSSVDVQFLRKLGTFWEGGDGH